LLIFQALITAHDQVTASRLFEKYEETDMEEDMDVSFGSVRIVRLVKEEQEPLVG
jgi:predicted Mrr-cat superfamily restriction endonuclease